MSASLFHFLRSVTCCIPPISLISWTKQARSSSQPPGVRVCQAAEMGKGKQEQVRKSCGWLASSTLPSWTHMGRATCTALVTWAPEQDCPYLVHLLLKTGTCHCFASLSRSADHILLFAIAFPMVKLALLLKFHSLLFLEHPQLSPDTRRSPGCYPAAGEMRAAQLFKSPHTPTLPSPATSPMSGLYQEEAKRLARWVLAIKKTSTCPFWRWNIWLSNVCTTLSIQLVFKRSTVRSLISLQVEKSLKKNPKEAGEGWCLQLHRKVWDILFFQFEAIHILYSIMGLYVLRWLAHFTLQSKNKNGVLYKLQHKKQPNRWGTIKETS